MAGFMAGVRAARRSDPPEAEVVRLREELTRTQRQLLSVRAGLTAAVTELDSVRRQAKDRPPPVPEVVALRHELARAHDTIRELDSRIARLEGRA